MRHEYYLFAVGFIIAALMTEFFLRRADKSYTEMLGSIQKMKLAQQEESKANTELILKKLDIIANEEIPALNAKFESALETTHKNVAGIHSGLSKLYQAQDTLSVRQHTLDKKIIAKDSNVNVTVDIVKSKAKK